MKSLSALCTMLAIVTLLAPTASAQNLFVNPGFETGGGSYDGWTTFGNGPNISTAANDNIFNSGVAASKIFGEFNGCPFPNFDVGGFFQEFSATPGKIYEMSGVSFVAAIDPIPGTIVCDGNRAIAKIAFFNSSGTEIGSNEIVVGGPNTPTETWIPFDVSAPAPAGTDHVQALILFLQPGCDTGSVFTDDLVFTESDAPTEPTNLLTNGSFDSGIGVGWTTFGNVFDEARNAFVRTPTGSAAMFSTFVEESPSGLTQTIPVVAGTEYELSAYVVSTCAEDPITGGNNNFLLARIEFKDAGGALVGEVEDTILDNASPQGTWTRQAIGGAAPAGAVSADIFFLFISPILEGGKLFIDDIAFTEGTGTSAPSAARGLVLEQNQPNPFNPKTTIRFALDRASDVSLRIFDAKGRLVNTLADTGFEAGSHALTWNGRGDDGRAVASGIYHYVLETANGRVARSMVLLK